MLAGGEELLSLIEGGDAEQLGFEFGAEIAIFGSKLGDIFFCVAEPVFAGGNHELGEVGKVGFEGGFVGGKIVRRLHPL